MAQGGHQLGQGPPDIGETNADQVAERRREAHDPQLRVQDDGGNAGGLQHVVQVARQLRQFVDAPAVVASERQQFRLDRLDILL